MKTDRDYIFRRTASQLILGHIKVDVCAQGWSLIPRFLTFCSILWNKIHFPTYDMTLMGI